MLSHSVDANERERGEKERKKKRSAIEVGPFANVILLLPVPENRILILDSRFSVQDIGGGHWIKSLVVYQRGEDTFLLEIPRGINFWVKIYVVKPQKAEREIDNKRTETIGDLGSK